ncbi:MAG TPA: hypothetical protein VMT62_16410 [Syntrophorhabdaceae bacterium]|nr:hypothetical protein [Syntrophorhabdaceae bacterium]
MCPKNKVVLLTLVLTIMMSYVTFYPIALVADENPPTIKMKSPKSTESSSDPATIRLSQDGQKEILVEVLKGGVIVTSGVKVVKGSWMIADRGTQFNKGSVFRAENIESIQLDPSMNIIIAKGRISIKGVAYDQGTTLAVSKDGKLIKK